MTQAQSKNIEENLDLIDEENEDTQEGRYLSFQLADEIYAIEIRHVTEIVGIQKITEVPDMAEYVKGVINLRGSVIPVIDVRLRFKMAPKDYNDRTCLIVVNLNDSPVGLVVDTVKEVISIEPEKISPPPKVSQGDVNKYIKGIARFSESVIILLALNKLLFDGKILEQEEE
eukprot:Anaeramoba_ignava/a481066_10.p2 GENE.a481066_10~~a481066_10.p2  ORF type:complete len:172 (-),score=13.26 a481066_10:98-613(-)